MLHILGNITAIMIAVTGIAVLWLGNWHKFKGKHFAVAFSTAAALWISVGIYFLPQQSCGEYSLPCLTYGVYHVARNIAFILFHIFVGYDVIEFKHKDRRNG